MPMYTSLLLPFFSLIHINSWSMSSRSSTGSVRWSMSSLMRIATPPPDRFCLGLLIHSYPCTLGCVFPSLVSASPIMWAFVVWASEIRLVTLPVIPAGFAYSRFIFFCFFVFLLFFFHFLSFFFIFLLFLLFFALFIIFSIFFHFYVFYLRFLPKGKIDRAAGAVLF